MERKGSRRGRVLNSAQLEQHRADRRRAMNANAKTIRKANRQVDAQVKNANTRAKYGPTMKPAPVTVRGLDTEA